MRCNFHARSLDDLIEERDRLGRHESVPEGEIIKARSTLWGFDPETGEPTGKILEWIKTREDPSFNAVHDAITEAFESYKGHSILPPPPTESNADLLALYPLADYHLGLYAWGEEAGEDWDVDKACEVLRSTMRELVSTTPPADTAIILNLGDFYHADNMQNRTTRSGHVLDVDTRYARVLSFGVQLMVEIAEMALQRHSRVLVRNLRGNHDDHSSVALTAAMGAFFHNNGRVEVDASPSAHWIYRHGRTLLGATHGDTLKRPENMAMLMAAANADDWGQSRYRYFHYGHVHHASAKEVGGVLVESHRTLAPKDAWAAAAGYISGRSMSSISYHSQHGEQSRRVCNIPHWRDD
jgi:predicted phosphodiesterase